MIARFTIVAFISCTLLGCSRAPETGPVDIRWDRETCARCSMSIGDRLFASEVRGGPEGERSEIYKFDDIGCAVIWLDTQTWKDDARVEVWVTDHRNGEWLDARDAWFVTGVFSPMDYGLGAQTDGEDEALNFEAAIGHVHDAERHPAGYDDDAERDEASGGGRR